MMAGVRYLGGRMDVRTQEPVEALALGWVCAAVCCAVCD